MTDDDPRAIYRGYIITWAFGHLFSFTFWMERVLESNTGFLGRIDFSSLSPPPPWSSKNHTQTRFLCFLSTRGFLDGGNINTTNTNILQIFICRRSEKQVLIERRAGTRGYWAARDGFFSAFYCVFFVSQTPWVIYECYLGYLTFKHGAPLQFVNF